MLVLILHRVLEDKAALRSAAGSSSMGIHYMYLDHLCVDLHVSSELVWLASTPASIKPCVCASRGEVCDLRLET